MSHDPGYWDSPLPRVFAHRGLADTVPENTLAAFRRALEAGASYLESDVRATKDGVAVLVHDPDLARTGGHPVTVEAVDWSDLRLLLVEGHPIPRLDEALAALPRARFNLDIKDAAAAAPAAAAIVAAHAESRVLLTSFSGRRRNAAARLAPGTVQSAVPGEIIAGFLLGLLGLHILARRVLRRVDAVQLPTRAKLLNFSSPRAIRAFQRAGVEVHFWTINEPEEMHRLLDAGADGLVTDRADLAVALIERRDSTSAPA